MTSVSLPWDMGMTAEDDELWLFERRVIVVDMCGCSSIFNSWFGSVRFRQFLLSVLVVPSYVVAREPSELSVDRHT